MDEGGCSMAGLGDGGGVERDEIVLESKHSVFLSHSGAQKSFVEQLCLDIEAHDRYPFFDKRRDSLPIGCDFPHMIFEGIEQCQVAVVVLSEEFFSRSKWPMLELAALVKRKTRDASLMIMPVFLGIKHAQCRDKRNHERWLTLCRSWAEKDRRIVVEDWEAVFKVFGYTNSIFLSENLDEVKCRQEIVDAVCKEVPPNTRRGDSHLQGRSRLYEVIHTRIGGMPLSKCYGSRILGIYGVGGIGKSTACMALCNYYFIEFEGRVCHVEFGGGNELQMLQEILKRLTNTKHSLIENFSKAECKDKMKRVMKNQKVMLAIDNVFESHEIINQAKDMLRTRFGQDSLLIVTARSREELQNVGVHDSECMEMPELLEDEAMSLFLYHAAPGLHLKNVEFAIEQLVRKCVKQCWFGKGDGGKGHYHPLALKVLGGQLGKDPKEWLGKLKEIDPFNQYREKDEKHPIFSILGRSFNSLKDEDRMLFIDVAAFCPKPYTRTMNIFEWLSMVHGKSVDAIKTMLMGLKRKSLLEKLGDGSVAIGMHDLWREFAIMIAQGRECALQPWIYEKVFGLNDPRREESRLCGGGWESLQRLCILRHKRDWHEILFVKEINLSCCSNLRVLQLVDVEIQIGVLDLSSLKNLRSLEVHCSRSDLRICGLGCLRNLVHLHLVCDVLSGLLDEDIASLNALHWLRLSHMERLPDLSKLNLLRVVIFYDWHEPESIAGLSSRMTNLKRLDLGFCTRLRSCHGVGELVALEVLDLSFCRGLEKLPHLGRLKNLLELNITGCEFIQTVPGLGDLVSLQAFQADGCLKLAELPDMHKLVNLKELKLRKCRLIQTIPGLSDLTALDDLGITYKVFEDNPDLCKLTKLETLSIDGWSAEGNLPCLSDLVNVKKLSILFSYGVDGFIGLSYFTCGLQDLVFQNCSFKDVQFLSSMTQLRRLNVMSCDELESLADMCKLARLEVLNVSDCESLRDWNSGVGLRLFGADLGGALLQLQELELWRVAFTELPDLSSLPQLRKLTLHECQGLTRLSSTAPLTALEYLSIYYCINLRTLQLDLTHLISAET